MFALAFLLAKIFDVAVHGVLVKCVPDIVCGNRTYRLVTVTRCTVITI
jgi:hypothetical protein